MNSGYKLEYYKAWIDYLGPKSCCLIDFYAGAGYQEFQREAIVVEHRSTSSLSFTILINRFKPGIQA